jgi:hypothetical protein
MTGKLYKSRNGTEHIVKVIDKHREMLKGEKLDNTAYTYQVLAQRQMRVGGDRANEDEYWNDPLFEPFSMEEELFLSEYEEIK